MAQTAFDRIMDGLGEEDRNTVLTTLTNARERAARDTKNRMKLIGEVRAGPIRMEAVEFNSNVTFTLCYDNDVMAHMGENAARMFCDFVGDTMKDRG